MTGNLWILLAAGGAVVAVFVALSLLADNYNPVSYTHLTLPTVCSV